MLVLDLEQANIHKLLQAKEATSVNLSDEVQHISLLSGLLPYAFTNRYHCLLSHCNFRLDLELARFDEVKCVTVSLTNIVNWFIGKEPLRVKDATNILY